MMCRHSVRPIGGQARGYVRFMSLWRRPLSNAWSRRRQRRDARVATLLPAWTQVRMALAAAARPASHPVVVSSPGHGFVSCDGQAYG